MQKNVVLDATMLSSLQSCARAFDNRFNKLHVPRGGKSNSLECGSLVHIILEYRNKAIIAGASQQIAQLEGFEAGKEYFHPYQPTNKYVLDTTHKGLVNTPEVGDSKTIGYTHVVKTMEEYFDYYKNDSRLILAAEETKGRIIYEDSDLRILWKAKIDCLLETNAGIMSKDYKTMKSNRSTNSMSNQFMGQCAILNSRNVIVDKIGFQKTLPKEEKFQEAIVNYSTDRLAEWANEIVPYYAHMLVSYQEVGFFPPNFTQCENKYGWCEFKRICEADRNLRELELKVNFEEGEVWDV